MIHTGRRVHRMQLGFVSNFCVVCRDFMPAQLIDLGTVVHVQLIPLGGFRHDSWECICTRCQTRTHVGNIGHPIQARSEPPAELDLASCMHMPQEVDRRLEYEMLATTDSSQTRVRVSLIVEAINRLAYTWEHRASYGPAMWAWKFVGIFGLFFTIIPAVMIAIIPSTQKGGLSPGWIAAFIVLFAIPIGCIGGAFEYYYRGRVRILRTYVLSRLVRALAPLDPSLSELNMAWDQVDRKGKWCLARVLTPDDVVSAMAKRQL